MKKSIATFVGVGLIALGSMTGCGRQDNSQYEFVGVIYPDSVMFEHWRGVYDNINRLTVIKKNGIIKRFVDEGDDLTVDYVDILDNRDSTAKFSRYTQKYFGNTEYEVEMLLMDGAQRQFEEYLGRIKEAKESEK